LAKLVILVGAAGQLTWLSVVTLVAICIIHWQYELNAITDVKRHA